MGLQTIPARMLGPALLICVGGAVSPAAEEARAPSFRHDVMAVLSKAGCNSGACHGNATGKGGFKLSLRGDYPSEDFATLVRDQFGRRVNAFEPEKSLLLLKPTNEIAHEGGKRFGADAWEYRVLRDWIAGGLEPDPEGLPTLEKVIATPEEATLIEPGWEVQIEAVAHFSDGTTRDVTALATYEQANEMAEISPGGKVRSDTAGETTVLVRYLNRQAPVRLAFVPARPDFQPRHLVAANFIDDHVFAKLERLRMHPSALCSDEVFVRRAWLDLLGLLPPAGEARRFVRSRKPDKRRALVDDLLERPEFADYWALKWADVLRNEERTLDRKGTRVFYDWIRRGIASGKPLNEFARELISARGSTYNNPPANYYRANRKAVTRAEAAAQTFLGVRLQCAQCHNHPFDRWTQDDYYDWAALFSRIDYKILENRRRDKNDKHEFDGEQVVFVSRQGGMKNPRTGGPAKPRFLAEASPLDDGADPLLELAAWVTSKDNAMFARTQVNRIWYHLMGRGLVDPIDDFRATNPASHPELLEQLARDFVGNGFDLRHTIRRIVNSRTYQLSSVPNESNRRDETNFSHARVRRLDAEVVLDIHGQVTGVEHRFDGLPAGVRAVEVPSLPTERRARSENNPHYDFMQIFGKPKRLMPSECERSSEPTMGQAFQLISGRLVHDMITQKDNRLDRLLAANPSNSDLLQQLYWTALTRAPSATEQETLARYLADAEVRRSAAEDILWGLLNAKEFVLRR